MTAAPAPRQHGRRRILVTGAAGMIGAPVAAALRARGDQAVPLDPVRPDGSGPDWLTGGLETVESAQALLARVRPDAIVHAGGISGPMVAPRDPYRVFETNVVVSMNLLEAARRQNTGRIVYCSSGAAYGDTVEDPVPESAPLHAKEMYGASKAMVESAVAVYRACHGVDVVSVRLSHVYGPGRRTDCAIRTMIADALARRATRLSWGRGYARPYCHLDDAVAGVLAALDAPQPRQPAYNVGAATVVPIERIAAIVQACLPGAEILLGDGAPAGATRRNLPDISAAIRDLGYTPAVDIETGIARYAEWARARGGVD